jgi:hypothetical protein
VSQPNPNYFAFVDRIIRFAATLDMTVALVPTWGRYVTGGFVGNPIIFDKYNAYDYGKFLGRRYPHHPFVLGADSVRYWNPETVKRMASGGPFDDLDLIDYGPVWEAMAQGLKDGEMQTSMEVFPHHEAYQTLITFHSCQCT